MNKRIKGDQLVSKDLVRRALVTGNYFIIQRDYVYSGILTRDEALFVQDLINLGHYRRSENKKRSRKRKYEKNGWFLCTRAFLMGPGSMLWSKETQIRLIKSLTNKGYVETKSKGMPKRRYLRVHDVKLWEDVCAAVQSSRIPAVQSSGFHADCTAGYHAAKNNKENKNKTNTVAGRSDRATSVGLFEVKASKSPAKTDSTPFDVEMAIALWKKVHHKTPMKRRASNIESWSTSIRLLRTEDGYKKKDIRQVMLWYLANCDNNPYCPQALSAKAFRDKFARIEDNMRRQQARQSPQQVVDTSDVPSWDED